MQSVADEVEIWDEMQDEPGRDPSMLE
jgi:hypothetical protein